MTHDAVDAMLANYRPYKSRCVYLQSVRDSLMDVLKSARATMIADANNGVQVLSDMPRGTNTSDPTARYGLLFAQGWEPEGFQEIEAQIAEIDEEISFKQITIHLVEEAFLPVLSAKGREVLEMRLFDKCSWSQMSEEYNKRHGFYLSRAAMKRIFHIAIDQIYDIAQ